MNKFFATIATIGALASALPATAQESVVPKDAERIIVKDAAGSKSVYVWSFTYGEGHVGHLLATVCGEEEKIFISAPGVLSSNRYCDGVRIDADAIVEELNG